MTYKVKQAEIFKKKGITGLYVNHYSNFDVSYIEITVEHKNRKNIKNNRLYLVADGKVQFILEGKVINLQKGD